MMYIGLSQKYLDADQDLSMCFVIYSKGFNNVIYDKLINILQKCNIEYHDIILIISKLYCGQTARVKYEEAMSKEINIKK